MNTVVILNSVNQEHLELVISEMTEMGAPTLRGFVTEDCIYLAEGSHRAVAAHRLGLAIEIEDLSEKVDLYENPDMLLSELFDHDFKVCSIFEGKNLIEVDCEY